MAYPKLDTPEVRAAQKEFAALLRSMMATKKRGLKATAVLGGTSERVLKFWLEGKTDPNPRVLRRFTARNDFDHAKLVDALRWNDPSIKV